jgi:diguanylate cyclase (GGDEF)-like protein/PAS domain S-box-containing protein
VTDDVTDDEGTPPTGVSRLTPEALDLVLASLLERRPRAGVAAIGESGLFVPLPDGLPLDGHPEITGVASAFQLVRPEDHPVLVDVWEQARLHGSAGGVVHPVDDPRRQVAMHVLDLRHRFGTFIGVMVGYRAGGAAPDEVEERLRPRVCTVTKDEVAVATGCDRAATLMLGFRADELVGRLSLEFLHPDDHQRAITSWMDLMHRPGSSRRVRVRHLRADGSWLWVEMTNHNRMADPDVGQVVCELVDISEEMAAQEAVRASEQLLRRLTEALPVGVVQLDPSRRVVYANDRTTSVLGRRLTAPPGSGYRDLVAAVVREGDRERLEALVTAALDDGVDGDLELEIHWVGGVVRRIEVAVRALTHEDRVSGALLCLSDVTESAALREELFRRATVDTLTGCLTRAALLPRLEELLAEAAPGAGRAVSVLFFDLDGFKRINDDHGHAVGDDLLAAVGARLLAEVAPGALVGRLGGDEFLVVGTAQATAEQVAAEAIRLRDAVQLVALLDGRVVSRVTVGWAWTDRPRDAAALVAAADADMYTHKTGRRR